MALSRGSQDSHDGVVQGSSLRDQAGIPLPRIDACFLIRFDKRVGYTIAWNRARDGLTLDGVEFKSLPSGLHEVAEDLIFFTQGQHTGLSAYKRFSASESERNAAFSAIGVLIPQQDGRLADVWLHAEHLIRLAKTANEDDNLTTELEKYWKKHSEESIDALQPHLNSPRQNIADLPLPRHHPGHAIVEILDLLGPLLFPLYRAALLRHRILILKKPPVELSCHLVYILSTLAALAESRSPPAITGDTQSTALFNIGVNDISYVQSRIPQRSPRTTNEPSPCRGWIACTSDVLIATKTTLYDLKLNFPSSPASQPTIHRSSGDKAKVKASQRDLRRYLRLRKALSSIGTDRTFSDESQDDSENAALLRTYTNVSQTHVPSPPEMDAYNDSTDALPWPAAAYEMFKSWASGGEATAALEAEAEHDGELLRGQSNVNYETESLRQPSRRGTPNLDVSPDTSPYELVVAYFHAWTDSIIGTLSQIVDSEAAARTPADDDNEETRSHGHIRVTVEGLVDMGLDVWSESDKEFVRDMVRTYFDVEADVEGGSVDLCGVKVY